MTLAAPTGKMNSEILRNLSVRIAFFDSGIGGLTVLKQALAALPNEEYLYFADTRNVPYGLKPKDQVQSHILAAAEFLFKQDIQALVVACNTATSVAISGLRQRYAIPIIGMEPAVKPALAKNKGKDPCAGYLPDLAGKQARNAHHAPGCIEPGGAPGVGQPGDPRGALRLLTRPRCRTT